MFFTSSFFFMRIRQIVAHCVYFINLNSCDLYNTFNLFRLYISLYPYKNNGYLYDTSLISRKVSV